MSKRNAKQGKPITENRRVIRLGSSYYLNLPPPPEFVKATNIEPGTKVPITCAHILKAIHTLRGKMDVQMPQMLIDDFLRSRRAGLSLRTLEFYEGYLIRASSVVGLDARGEDIRHFLGGLACSNGGRHAYYRTLRAFYGWLYSQKSGFGLKPQDNPILAVEAPKVEKRIMPALLQNEVAYLIGQATNVRNQAIISLLADSGLRLAELANIHVSDIDWTRRLIKAKCKGSREALAPFGLRTEALLRQWLHEHNTNGRLWNINSRGIQAMLGRLEVRTGLKCNPHTFRRTFATVLAKRGVDALHIMRLGRWESLSMVQRYTASVGFSDSLQFYSPIVADYRTKDSNP